MHTALRVSLAPTQKRGVSDYPAAPLLAHEGAAVILGATPAAHAVTPTDRTCFAPRGACVAADGSLWVADTGHHRLLGWPAKPDEDGAPAQYLVGQPDFECEGRNAKSARGAATLNVPTGIAACGEGLAVADAWNHRVLLWRKAPRGINRPADVVLGQCDFLEGEPNRGRKVPDASTLFWPYGVAWDGERLWVADTGNRRVLVWNGVPERHGRPADLALGQATFDTRDENAAGAPSRASMRWPHAIAFLRDRVCIADAGNNRVMIWNRTPAIDGAACDVILGQSADGVVDHNQGEYWPTAATLNMPYALAAVGPWLAVADTASSRLLAWHERDLEGCGSPARLLAGQHRWDEKGDNRWQAPSRDSVCWPFGLSAAQDCAVIADSGNNRVLLWRWSEEAAP